jgi:glycosyltransferase involved in cell wall biosynthesis
MTRHERITVGISCYNAQDTILRAVESACQQDWPNKDIFIVDDASTDESVRVIRKYIKQIDGVRLIVHKVNKGVGGVRQTIVDQAEGKFIAFFDDDDESMTTRLSTQYQRICNYEQMTGISLIACYASGRQVYPNGHEVEVTAIGTKPDIPHGSEVADRLLFFGGNPNFFIGAGTPASFLMARRSTFQAVGGFDLSFRRVEDVDFAIRLALQDGHFIGCQEHLVIRHATDAADKSPEKNRNAEIQLTEKYEDYLVSKTKYIYAKKWPLLRYYHFKKQYIRFLLILIELILRYPRKTLTHFFTTAPKRFLHERKIKEKPSS